MNTSGLSIEAELKTKQVTQKIFSFSVEKTIMANGGDVIDAILVICDEHAIDPSDCSKFLSKPLKEKFTAYAADRRLIPKGNQLPI
jgi:hypothetical protein